MEPVNKTRTKRPKKRKTRTASGCGTMETRDRQVSQDRVKPPTAAFREQRNRDCPALLRACLSGNLAPDQFPVQSSEVGVNDFDFQGQRSLHAVLSSQSSTAATACLRDLLERGAAVNTTTDSGQTPLHVAASEDLLDCAKILVDAGADVLARDDMGQTPFDLACSWKVARFLKHCMWYEEKKRKEVGERPASPHRLSDPQDFEPQDIQNVPRRRRPQGKSTSPWTEVAEHLGVVEPLEQESQETQFSEQ